MSISTRGRYGVRALLTIVKANQSLSTARIAELEGMSLPYLEQIFNRLKKAGLIQAKRGAHGGFSLSRPAAEVTVGQVIEILDGPVTFSHCHKPDAECDRVEYCSSRHFWSALESDVNAKLFNTSLQDLVDMEAGLQAKVQKGDGAAHLS